MRSFKYTIKDQLGIHARPAGMLSKEGLKFESHILITKGTKTIDAKKLLGIMGLGIKCGESILIEIDGVDEEEAYCSVKEFFETNL